MLKKYLYSYLIVQCISVLATGHCHRGWGHYKQLGRYLCNARALSSIGVEVAIDSAVDIYVMQEL